MKLSPFWKLMFWGCIVVSGFHLLNAAVQHYILSPGEAHISSLIWGAIIGLVFAVAIPLTAFFRRDF